MYVAAPMLALLLWNIVARAADPRAELAASYAEVPQAADHVVLLDLGGASSDRVEQLRATVLGIAAALPVGDRLTVYTFSDVAAPAIRPVMIDEAGREALAAQIQAMPLTPGASSDLGAGLAAARETLRTTAHLDGAVITMISDFCHEPPDGSPYSFPGMTGCRQVRGLSELSDGFDALNTSMLIAPVAITVGKADPIGKAAFFQALGKGDTLAFSEPAELAERYAEGLPWRKLKGLVRRELALYDLSAEVIPSEGDRVRVRVSSGLDKLSVELNSVTFSDPALVPAKKKLSLTPSGEAELIVQGAEAPFSLIPRTRTVVVDGSIRANATLEPRAGLSRLGLSPGRGQVRIPLHVEWRQRYGPPGWLLGVIGLGALGLLSVLTRRFRQG